MIGNPPKGTPNFGRPHIHTTQEHYYWGSGLRSKQIDDLMADATAILGVATRCLEFFFCFSLCIVFAMASYFECVIMVSYSNERRSSATK